MLATCIVAEEIAYESSSMGGVCDGNGANEVLQWVIALQLIGRDVTG
jgi:hypothetical protein